jgi:LemA protein
MPVLVILLLIVAVVVWLVVIYNRLVRDRNRVATAWSDIDVQLKRRYDLIPKLVTTVEAYARHERTTLATLTELRSRTRLIDEIGAKGPIEQQIGSGLRQLIALAEAYPDLKADGNFLQLQRELTDIENQIQYARRYYNGAVRNLNTRIESFPDLLIAKAFRFTPQPFFELGEATEAQPPEWPAR